MGVLVLLSGWEGVELGPQRVTASCKFSQSIIDERVVSGAEREKRGFTKKLL